MKKYSLLKNIISIAVLLLTIGGGFWVINNYRYLLDVYAKSTSSSESLATTYSKSLNLTNKASLILYGTYPEVKEKSDFNSKCNPEQNVIELGCYQTGKNKIYLLNINEPNLEGIESVTIAHELLHAAYERLTTKEKKDINSLVEKQLDKYLNDDNLLKRLKNYETSEPGSQNNELYSIFGTEYKDLSPELEKYYEKYFLDRQKIVNLNTQNETYLSQKEQDLLNQKQLIENLQSKLKTLENKMEKLKKSDSIDQYNLLVPQQNTLVEEIKREVESYNNQVNLYNDIINSINSRSYSSFDTI